MPIVYDRDIALTSLGQTYSYSDRDVMLYALGIGMGADPMNLRELAFVNESSLSRNPLKVVPTFASVATFGAGLGLMDIDWVLLVDGERDIVFHKPLPSEARLKADFRVPAIYDKGQGKGAVILQETVISDEATGDRLATVTASLFARGDGGFGGPKLDQPRPHGVPSRAPDMSVDIPTLPHQALLYRLSGDRNPLHSDPEFAAKAGFPRPVLHGLCTYGLSCRAVLQTYADYDPNAFRRHSARFSAPVYPGETLTFDLWKDGEIVSFEARIKARDVTVIKSGKTILG